ncbi:hypothetical protein TNCT_267171 [Trichonephila clavata]|uniref:Uncharacterized protein n=1 Tax=Trichonephila clavata TaxID=2740835 RepID=A0A8X6KCI3_TRICU|nr:hypothetical protein TNCT_267171 [Trichonephila clavata]
MQELACACENSRWLGGTKKSVSIVGTTVLFAVPKLKRKLVETYPESLQCYSIREKLLVLPQIKGWTQCHKLVSEPWQLIPFIK